MQFVNIIQFSSRVSTKIKCEHKKRVAQMSYTNREKVEKNNDNHFSRFMHAADSKFETLN